VTSNSNLWQATAPDPVPGNPLLGKINADAVVIGGGYTGLSAALHLAEHGANVCVLEAHRVGHGGSGRNVGLVNAGLWTPPDRVEQILGPTEGKRLNACLANGPQLVFDLIERHGIDCDATRRGTLHCAHSPSGVRDLTDRFRQQITRGAPVRLLDAVETASRTGAKGLYGALHDARAGTIQPLSYALELAQAAISAGATIYQNTPARGLKHHNGHWIVDTPEGTVSAPHLIQATNAYDAADIPKNHFVTMHYMQCATPVLSPEQRDTILPGGEGCWDTAKVMTSFRLNAEGRLLIGGIGDLKGFAGTQHRAWAARKLRHLFPHLHDVGFEFCWSGKVAVSDTYLPKISGIGPRAVSIFGYSGRGIAPGTVFGKAAANWVASGDNNALPVAITVPKSGRLITAKSLCYELGAALTHIGSARL
jgi:sarcosine oxidase